MVSRLIRLAGILLIAQVCARPALAATVVQDVHVSSSQSGQPIDRFSGNDLLSIDLVFNVHASFRASPDHPNIAGYITFAFDRQNMSTPANFTIDVSGTASMPCGTFCSLTYVDTFVRHIEDPEILALFTSTDPIQARTYANIYAFGSADSSFDGTLTYTYGPTRTSDAPEPATWAMMITGFLATGSALRRRRRLAPLTA